MMYKSKLMSFLSYFCFTWVMLQRMASRIQENCPWKDNAKGLEKKEDILKISNVSLRFKRIKYSLERTLLTMYSKHLDSMIR